MEQRVSKLEQITRELQDAMIVQGHLEKRLQETQNKMALRQVELEERHLALEQRHLALEDLHTRLKQESEDRWAAIDKRHAEQAIANAESTDKLNALISVMDSWIRGNRPQ